MADLARLSDVKAWLATNNPPIFPPTDDALLARLITACSVFIESWLSRPIGLANWQEVRTGLGNCRMQLAATPVQAILSLAIHGKPITAAPALTATSQFSGMGYFFTPSEIEVSGWNFWRGSRIVVEYTAGYDPIPSDIEQTCIEMVVRKYRERTRIAERTRSIGGNESVAYETVMFTKNDMASDIQVLLSQYRLASPLMAPTLLPPPPTTIPLGDQETTIVLEDLETPIVRES